MFEFLNDLPLVVLIIVCFAVIVAGHWLAKGWTTLIKQTLKGSLRSLFLYYGKVFFRAGSWVLVIMIIPWSSFNISESLVAFFGLIIGMVISRLDNLLAALTGGAAMARLDVWAMNGWRPLAISS